MHTTAVAQQQTSNARGTVTGRPNASHTGGLADLAAFVVEVEGARDAVGDTAEEVLEAVSRKARQATRRVQAGQAGHLAHLAGELLPVVAGWARQRAGPGLVGGRVQQVREGAAQAVSQLQAGGAGLVTAQATVRLQVEAHVAGSCAGGGFWQEVVSTATARAGSLVEASQARGYAGDAIGLLWEVLTRTGYFINLLYFERKYS